ncbi:MAG TPA: transaldolase, partial [Sulfitobacter sp.]|nr:transaldolase [Sulfitobacter sp.]
MKLYLDTADTTAWDDLMPTGMFYGITTNPLLAVRAGLD